MKEQADRFNDGKVQWSLVDFPTLEGMVRVLEYGAKKYSPHNWKKGMTKEKIFESMFRHLVDHLNGEHNDHESGLPHVDHVMCNAMFLAYAHNKELHAYNK